MKAIFTHTAAAMMFIVSFTNCASGKNLVEETRPTEAFSSIEINSVATVHFTQADSCSLRMEGTAERLRETVCKVEGGTLVVDYKDKDKRRGRWTKAKEMNIYLSAPDLKKVDFDGVGSFRCEGKLSLQDVAFDVDGVGSVDIKDLECRSLRLRFDGVGSADIHVNCEQLRADIDGVGRVKLSGQAGVAKIRKDGVGSVSTENLKTNR